MATTMTLSPIEQIAQDIADWGDGWSVERADDDGARVNLIRMLDRWTRITVDIQREPGQRHIVNISSAMRIADTRWTPVSVSLRNPITRRALDEINRRVDGLERGGG